MLGNILKVLGLIVILLIIWLASGWILWLENPRNMFLAMAVPVSLLVAWEAFKRARAIRANNKLSSAVVDQAKADQRPSGDVVQLRERFDEAVAMLKQQKKRGGLGLYELPWYVIIGAPGSGKTTALKYSGLKFPLEQRSGRGALRGVGGTRNCDWWFTEEAVLLDTAGRYTTQDSDASADSAGWTEFLTLLKKHRKRRPLNGVLLAISAQDLMTQGKAGREAHVIAARRRLSELNKELRIQLPVYVLVTKCDLIAGFGEYFDDMSQEERAQVLGVTFPQDVTYTGAAANAFPAEFDAIVQRLNERVYERLEDERDARRRAKIFGFPQQMASLREGLADFIGEVFETNRFDQRVLLRGVYFTSGTQEGTPIDRLLGALSRRIAVAPEAVAPSGKGKAYFIERLMKQVVLAESGIAGVSRKLELQKAAAQFGVYIATLAIGGIVLLLMIYSYKTNQSFLADFEGRARALTDELRRPGTLGTDPDIPARPRLDRIRGFITGIDAYRNQTSWVWRGWGLDQSHSVEEAVGILYKEELRQALAATVKQRIEQRLQTLLQGREPLDVYETLRAYLMLRGTGASYFDSVEVRNIARKEWEAIYRGRQDQVTITDSHFAWLLKAGLQETRLNDQLVGRARAAIPPNAVPEMLLSRIKREYEKKVAPGGQAPPSPIDGTAFVTRSGKALGAGLPVVFTKPGFHDTDALIKKVEKQFSEETWVWDRTPPESPGTRNEVWRLYEDQFIREWELVLADMGVPPNTSAIGDYLLKIGGDNNGLKALFTTVDEHTSLVPEIYEKPPTILASPRAWIAGLGDRLQGRSQAPGSRVTERFAPIHWLVNPINGKVVIDDILASLRPMAALVKASDPQEVGGDPGANVGALQQSVDSFKQNTTGLPGPAGSLTALANSLTNAVTSASAGNLIAEIDGPHKNFIDACQKVINNRFPFFPTSLEDATPDDLKSIFGSGGALETLEKTLVPYVDERGGDYVAKKMSGQPLRIDAVLNTLQAAARIRRFLFSNRDGVFSFRLSVEDSRLDDRFVRFELSDILFTDGKRLDFSNQKQGPKPAAWPTKAGSLEARFFEHSGPSQMKSGDGHWNLFRLIRQGTLDMLSETTFTLKLTAGNDYILLGIKADSVNNPLVPFASGAFEKFRCR